MPSITFRHPDGAIQTVEAATGTSVMQAARTAGIDGILAECGGEMVCATCHVYVVSTELLGCLPPRSAFEDDMLGFTSEPCRDSSRLSCQLLMTDAIDGLVVELPRTQV